MNINELTIGQAREIAALFGSLAPADGASHPAVGQYCIVRCRDAGVHAGVVSAFDGQVLTLVESRRLWRWKAAHEHTCTGIARHGITAAKSTVAAALPVS